MKKSKDVKFIIYQALYIFVVCVIAIKGADLNLDAVELKKMIEPGYVYIDTSGKILIDRDKADNLINFDSTRYVIISRDEFNKEPEKFTGLIITNPGNLGSVQEPLQSTTIEKIVVDIVPKIEIVIGGVTLYKYHENIIQNQGNNPINVSGVTIPAHSTGKVTLGGESAVTITVGDISKTVNVLENKKPSVSFQRVTTMGEDVKATTLQRMVGFRVTITDDFPSQLDVKFNGPVSVKKTSDNTYDVTMNAFGSRNAYDNYISNRNEPYSVGFTVSVTDKLAPHSITGQNQFLFSEW